MGSKTYLADPTFSNEQLAADAEGMHPVEKAMSVGEMRRRNVKIFGKGTTPLLVMRASAVPEELIRRKCDQSGGGNQAVEKREEGAGEYQ